MNMSCRVGQFFCRGASSTSRSGGPAAFFAPAVARAHGFGQGKQKTRNHFPAAPLGGIGSSDEDQRETQHPLLYRSVTGICRPHGTCPPRPCGVRHMCSPSGGGGKSLGGLPDDTGVSDKAILQSMLVYLWPTSQPVLQVRSSHMPDHADARAASYPPICSDL
jgi:hypothetical protein